MTDAPATPRDAASLILVRREGGSPPRVLMGQRGRSARFMPSKFVFPGGALEPADADAPCAAELTETCLRRLALQAPPGMARGLGLSAIRETWEETGLALGAPSTDHAPETAPESWRGFYARGLAPALDRLRFVFRAITPPTRPVRFDARFFMADAAGIAGDPDDFSGAEEELSHLSWLTIAEARTLDLPFITTVVLAEVEQRLSDPSTARRPSSAMRAGAPSSTRWNDPGRLPPLGGAPPQAPPPRGPARRDGGHRLHRGVRRRHGHDAPAVRAAARGDGLFLGMIGLNGAMVAVAALVLAPVMPAGHRPDRPARLPDRRRAAGRGLAGGVPVLRLLTAPGWRCASSSARRRRRCSSARRPGSWRTPSPPRAGASSASTPPFCRSASPPGPMILIGVGVDGPGPFLVCAALSLICIAPVVSAWRDAPAADPEEGGGTSPWRFFVMAPTVLGAVVLFGAIEFGVMGLMPVWGVRTGLDADAASFLISALVLGNVALQIPSARWPISSTAARC
jgi:8-oxo-dGTP pyrophosphatase MutT (NUDIX family)